MSTDLKKRVTPKADPSNRKTELAELLESGIGDVSLRELLGMLISSVGASERKAYLSRESQDKANGFTTVPFKSDPFRSIFAFRAPEPESSGRRVYLPAIAAVTAKKSRPCCWDCSARAARSMPPKTHSRRWACPARNRIWNVSRRE